MKIILNCAVELFLFNDVQCRPAIFQLHPKKQWDQHLSINGKVILEMKCPATGTWISHHLLACYILMQLMFLPFFAPMEVSQPPEADTARGLSQPYEEERRVSVT